MLMDKLTQPICFDIETFLILYQHAGHWFILETIYNQVFKYLGIDWT